MIPPAAILFALTLSPAGHVSAPGLVADLGGESAITLRSPAPPSGEPAPVPPPLPPVPPQQDPCPACGRG